MRCKLGGAIGLLHVNTEATIDDVTDVNQPLHKNDEVAVAVEPSTQQSHKKTTRIHWLDVLKGVLIFLVVLGHVMLPINNDTPLVGIPYDAIYAFHMPLFVFVSGLCAKHTMRDGKLRIDRIMTYVAIGLIFNLLVRMCDQSTITLPKLLTFSSAPWYVISLATWMLLVPFFDRLKPVVGVGIAVAASLVMAVSPVHTDFLAISRTASFMVWFMLGYYVPVDAVGHLREGKMRWACVAIGIVSLVLFVGMYDELRQWLFLVNGNNVTNLGIVDTIIGKGVMTAFAVALSVGVIVAVPSSLGFLEMLGKRTLQVYVIHRLVRGLLKSNGFYDLLTDDVTMLLMCVELSIVICFVAAIKPIKVAFDKVTSCRWGWALRE